MITIFTSLAHLPATFAEYGYLLLAVVGIGGLAIVALDAANLWLAPASPQVLQQRRHSVLLLRAMGVLVASLLLFVALAVFVSTWAYRLQ